MVELPEDYTITSKDEAFAAIGTRGDEYSEIKAEITIRIIEKIELLIENFYERYAHIDYKTSKPIEQVVLPEIVAMYQEKGWRISTYRDEKGNINRINLS